jgi:hypothetical protein
VLGRQLGRRHRDGDGIDNASDPAATPTSPGHRERHRDRCGQDDCCAIAGSRPVCWGLNQLGDLGVGITGKGIVGPTEVQLPCLGTSPGSTASRAGYFLVLRTIAEDLRRNKA